MKKPLQPATGWPGLITDKISEFISYKSEFIKLVMFVPSPKCKGTKSLAV